MTDSGPEERSGSEETPPPDEEYALTYLQGYEEGLRSGLKELLAHAARGHTVQELRLLVASRVAQIPEEIDRKRRSLLSPPRPSAWEPLLARLRAPPRPWGAGAPSLRIAPGTSYLVREDRPTRSIELVREAEDRFPRTVILSLSPGDVATRGARVEIPLEGAGAGPGTVTLESIGGRLRESVQGGALLFTDAVEFIASRDGIAVTVNFLYFLAGLARSSGSAVVVSLDPRSLEPKELGRVEKAFQILL